MNEQYQATTPGRWETFPSVWNGRHLKALPSTLTGFVETISGNYSRPLGDIPICVEWETVEALPSTLTGFVETISNQELLSLPRTPPHSNQGCRYLPPPLPGTSRSTSTHTVQCHVYSNVIRVYKSYVCTSRTCVQVVRVYKSYVCTSRTCIQVVRVYKSQTYNWFLYSIHIMYNLYLHACVQILHCVCACRACAFQKWL